MASGRSVRYPRFTPVAGLRAALFIALAVACSAGNAQGVLTLEEAQRRAVERSGQIAALDSARIAAREMAVAAGQLPDPVARLQVNNLPVNGEDRFSLTRDFMTMRSVGVMQEFTRADKRRSRAERFEREADRTRAEKAATLAAIERETALAWLERHYAEAMTAVVAEQDRAGRDEIEGAESGYRAGRGSLAEVLNARSALVGIEDQASVLARRLQAARIALARWVGEEGTDAALGSRPDIDRIPVDVTSLAATVAHLPDIELMQEKEAVAAAEVRVAEANRKTDWSVELMYSQRGPAYSNMVSLAVSVPLQWDRRNRQDRELAARLAMVDQVRAEREDLIRARTAEVRAMVVEWENTRERRKRYERELLPLATERTRATLAAYRGARAGIGEVLAARRAEIELRMQVLQIEREAARLWAQLAFLLPHDHASPLRSIGSPESRQ